MNRSEICALAASLLLLVTVSSVGDDVQSLRGELQDRSEIEQMPDLSQLGKLP